jgi:anaerobic magnesium-protoporphyrin IX monomethyl ester cyclase
MAASNRTVTIIIPPVVVHHLDPHTGIPFMPHIAAHLAGSLKQEGYSLQILDCFGIQPHQREVLGEFMLLGMSAEEAAGYVSQESRMCFVYCRTMSESIAVMRIIKALRKRRNDLTICLFENTQAVTSFSLRDLAPDFIAGGCDVMLMGDPERRAVRLIECLAAGASPDEIPGIAFKGADGIIRLTGPAAPEQALGDLPLPAWELFPLEGYWIVGFAHAPISGNRFLPLLTSRGCPYRCKFCIAPALNYSWVPRPASNVVDEMEHFYKTMGIGEFHISDLNPTISDSRIREMCRDILRRKLPVVWKLAQGTKIETIKSEETLELMAQAGCSYISFSPESGSEEMLKRVDKPFDFEHALRMLRKMNALGIRTQACFIAGLPGETAGDRGKSLDYMKRLVADGLDEINVPVFTPVPGSDLAASLDGYTHYAQCTFSPTWRKDYRRVSFFRYRMYTAFFLHKLGHPRKVFREVAGFLTGRYETKMEMSFFKLFKLIGLRYFPWIFRRLEYHPRDGARKLLYGGRNH